MTINVGQSFVTQSGTPSQSGVLLCLVGNTFPLQFPRVARLPPVDGAPCFLCLCPVRRSAATGTDRAIGNIGQGFRVIWDIATGNT